MELKKLAPWIIVLAVALGVRALYLFEIMDNPFFDHPVVDEMTYDNQAKALVAGDADMNRRFATTAYYQSPIYSFFLAAIYGTFGRDFLWVRIIQALIGAASALLVYALGLKMLGRKTALVCSLAAAAYPVTVYFDAELLSTPLITLFCLAAILTLLAKRWLAAGLFLGLALITRGDIGLFIVASMLYAWIESREKKDLLRRLAPQALIVAPIILCVLPITLRNYRVTGDLVLLSTNPGLNFYLGNNPDYPSTVEMRPSKEWTEFMAEPMKQGLTRASDHSRYYFGKSWQSMKEDASWVPGVLANKVWRFVNGREWMRNREIYPFRGFSRYLWGTLWIKGVAFPYGLLSPFAVLGLALGLFTKSNKAVRLSSLFVLCLGAATVIFFVTSRYRAPVLGVQILLAGLAVERLTGWAREKRTAALAAGCAGLLGVGLLANVGSGSEPVEFNPDALAGAALQIAHEGDMELAENFLVRALKQDPTYALAYNNLANMQSHTGRLNEAVFNYFRALENNPEYELAQKNLMTTVNSLPGANEDLLLAAAKAALEPRSAERRLEFAGALEAAGQPDLGLAQRIEAQRLAGLQN